MSTSEKAGFSQPSHWSVKPPRISVGTWAFAFGPYQGDPWSFRRVCEYAAEVGYYGVEINGFRPHPHPDDFIGGKGLGELRSLHLLIRRTARGGRSDHRSPKHSAGSHRGGRVPHAYPLARQHPGLTPIPNCTVRPSVCRSAGDTGARRIGVS